MRELCDMVCSALQKRAGANEYLESYNFVRDKIQTVRKKRKIERKKVGGRVLMSTRDEMN